jgi:hypothetical protein
VRQTLYELRFEGYTVSYSKTLQQTCRDLFSMMFVPSGPLFLKTLVWSETIDVTPCRVIP